jgi:hypothetical protein
MAEDEYEESEYGSDPVEERLDEHGSKLEDTVRFV